MDYLPETPGLERERNPGSNGHAKHLNILSGKGFVIDLTPLITLAKL
jgi:hypothetical protein